MSLPELVSGRWGAFEEETHLLLSEHDCRHGWQPGCGEPKPVECCCWENLNA